jgi:RNA polymerase sigma-70 factor, ECF subfamily
MVHRDSERDDDVARERAAAEAVARDLALVARVRRGDMDAYGELVRRHMRRAFSIAYGILRHRQDAEDVVQEAFMRTLERIDQIDAGRPFHPWFHRVVVNQAISYGRARAVRATSPIGDELRSAAPSPDRRVEQSELRERLLHALDSLPETQRTIVLLADVEDMNSTEIAAVLEMPAGTVRYHLHLGRRALRDSLSAADEEAR